MGRGVSEVWVDAVGGGGGIKSIDQQNKSIWSVGRPAGRWKPEGCCRRYATTRLLDRLLIASMRRTQRGGRGRSALRPRAGRGALVGGLRIADLGGGLPKTGWPRGAELV